MWHSPLVDGQLIWIMSRLGGEQSTLLVSAVCDGQYSQVWPLVDGWICSKSSSSLQDWPLVGGQVCCSRRVDPCVLSQSGRIECGQCLCAHVSLHWLSGTEHWVVTALQCVSVHCLIYLWKCFTSGVVVTNILGDCVLQVLPLLLEAFDWLFTASLVELWSVLLWQSYLGCASFGCVSTVCCHCTIWYSSVLVNWTVPLISFQLILLSQCCGYSSDLLCTLFAGATVMALNCLGVLTPLHCLSVAWTMLWQALIHLSWLDGFPSWIAYNDTVLLWSHCSANMTLSVAIGNPYVHGCFLYSATTLVSGHVIVHPSCQFDCSLPFSRAWWNLSIIPLAVPVFIHVIDWVNHPPSSL